ncbi:glycoside hydrolase family 55 protein [Fictibacillus iocasae]|uniref:Glycoside hydrolase family 55 protein n=1 Tax=Fictibacillus iocasae TaxID=2715437 RepID=A0ABW2NMQ9_9BACL
MIHLPRDHDPMNNAQLIGRYGARKMELPSAVEETELLFQDIYNRDYTPSFQNSPTLSLFKTFKKLIKGMFVEDVSNRTLPPTRTVMDENGMPCPEWLPTLNREYDRLFCEITKTVNVKDFGAKGDGVTDDTAAFEKAIGTGSVHVVVPAGVYMTKGIKLPSWTSFSGEGKGITVIKLHNEAPIGRRLITNSRYIKGNHHIAVRYMTLDWNVERLGDIPKTAAGNNQSSCLTFAHVTYGWVQNVEAINPGLHCFDVSSAYYTYLGDGTRARYGSRYIWLDNLNGYGFGDDGITTHHSEDLFISNSHMCDPSGRSHKLGFSNSNGIEVDDGSRNVWLLNNSTARCFGGIEIKAHHNSAAAANVHIIGHLSVNDNRAYNFRHIGHHQAADTESLTAFNIKATNLIAAAPIRTSLYEGSQQRALVVSGYKNVVINHFTAIGDSDYDYNRGPVLAVQYRARNVVLNNVHVTGFKTAGVDMKVFGGDNAADIVRIGQFTADASAEKTLVVGSGVTDIELQNVYAVRGLTREKVTL